jgi:hypothetical protein
LGDYEYLRALAQNSSRCSIKTIAGSSMPLVGNASQDGFGRRDDDRSFAVILNDFHNYRAVAVIPEITRLIYAAKPN